MSSVLAARSAWIRRVVDGRPRGSTIRAASVTRVIIARFATIVPDDRPRSRLSCDGVSGLSFARDDPVDRPTSTSASATSSRSTASRSRCPGGQVFGFLGANGAGKTTTMRIALGVLEADAGTVDLARRRQPALPRRDVGLPARGARPLPADDASSTSSSSSPRSTASRATSPGARRCDWLAPVPRPGPRRAPRRRALEGQPAEDPADRRGPPRPEVLLMDEPFTGPRPGERRAAPRGVPRAARRTARR